VSEAMRRRSSASMYCASIAGSSANLVQSNRAASTERWAHDRAS
jgi:hypothetical protein